MLSDKWIAKHIKKVYEEEEYGTPSSDDIKLLTQLQHELMNEKQFMNQNAKEQETMLDYNIVGYANGEDYARLRNNLSENKHMEYFDNFLYPNAMQDVLQSIIPHGVSTDIFKGLKPMHNNVPPVNKSGTVVVQEVEHTDDDSVRIIGFAIIHKGEIIFEYGYFQDIDINIYLNEKQNPTLNIFDMKGEDIKDFEINEIIRDREITVNNEIYKQQAYVTRGGKVGIRYFKYTAKGARFAKSPL